MQSKHPVNKPLCNSSLENGEKDTISQKPTSDYAKFLLTSEAKWDEPMFQRSRAFNASLLEDSSWLDLIEVANIEHDKVESMNTEDGFDAHQSNLNTSFQVESELSVPSEARKSSFLPIQTTVSTDSGISDCLGLYGSFYASLNINEKNSMDVLVERLMISEARVNELSAENDQLKIDLGRAKFEVVGSDHQLAAARAEIGTLQTRLGGKVTGKVERAEETQMCDDMN
jgi:hypothetical protein